MFYEERYKVICSGIDAHHDHHPKVFKNFIVKTF